jgi:hypothetical protein
MLSFAARLLVPGERTFTKAPTDPRFKQSARSGPPHVERELEREQSRAWSKAEGRKALLGTGEDTPSQVLVHMAWL